VKKAAIIGIVIAIVVAGIAGTYAVTSLQNETSKTPEISLDDSATVEIVEEEASEAPVQEEEGVGFKDSAEAEIEEPDEPIDVHNVTVQDRFGFSDPP